MSNVKPIPEGYHSVTPYLIVRGASKALDFYKRAFGAAELFRMEGTDGRIGHAEIKIGDSPIMLADEHPEIGAKGPESWGGSAVSLMLYVGDVDAIFAQAVEAGATVERPITNQFYGDRTGGLKDPSATTGTSPRISRMSRPRNWRSGRRRWGSKNIYAKFFGASGREVHSQRSQKKRRFAEDFLRVPLLLLRPSAIVFTSPPSLP